MTQPARTDHQPGQVPVWAVHHRLPRTLRKQRWGHPPPVEGGRHRELSTPTHSQVPAEFLGMVNIYHRFIPKAAQLMCPLYEALKNKAQRHAVDRSEERDMAFREVKNALANSTMLAHPTPNAPISITTDALDYAVDAVHEQWVNGAWQPFAFFSQQLCPSERKYSTFDRQLLGLYLAIRHFHFLLEARQFTAFVDHK